MHNDRTAAHKAKMAREAARVLTPVFIPVDDKRFAAERLRRRALGQHVFPNIGKPILTHTSHAQVNCKTGLAHQHLREIARRTARA